MKQTSIMLLTTATDGVGNTVNPASGATYVQTIATARRVPGPVGAPIVGYHEGDPICLTGASDGKHDGFGFENNRTYAVVEGRTATKDKPLLGKRWCQRWAEINYGDYVLQNNT